MGRVYSIHRYAPDTAVDLLSLRRRVQDVDHPTFYAPLHRYRDASPRTPPRTLDFVSAYNNADLAVVVGPECEGLVADSMWRWHETHETEDPRLWATRGARRVGWHKHVPTQEGAGDFLLRYSVPQDIDAITKELERLSVADVQSNVAESYDAGLVETEFYRTSSHEISREALVHEVAPNLLKTLRMFYAAAQAEGEIAVYVLR